jgi:hypothetical protein
MRFVATLPDLPTDVDFSEITHLGWHKLIDLFPAFVEQPQIEAIRCWR